ncbi:MAG: CehA/McbA family metallohydrolase [Mycobacteriales bacterium]
MADYEAVDLRAAYNAGVDVLGERGVADDLPLGRVELRGLPFLIGPEPPASGRCFLEPRIPVSVALGMVARRLIIAHRQLSPGAPAGHAVGETVADYAFALGDGEVIRVPIRERFEIQVVPPEWGREPFLAVSDTNDHNLPRFEGRWGAAGMRLAEHAKGWARGYYLWCWENPRPDVPIERLEITPHGTPFLLAGITVGHADEHPFVRTPARPVRVVARDDGADGALDLAVDRGVATYPQPLPVDDDRPGWGAADPTSRGDPAYATVAAIPSATLQVSRGGEQLGAVRWGDVERDGHADSGRVRVELVDPGRNWVHVAVVDEATGRPVPCRVHFRSPEGIPYQPHGHHNHVAQNLGSWHYDVGGDLRLGQQSYAYIDGTCQGWLPRGDVVVDVARGFEYAPIRETVHIEPGQRELTLRLRRVADMASTGWWSGDSHVHFLSTAGAQLEQRGEDLHVVNLLQAQWGALFTNTEDFARPNVVDRDGYVTYVGQENRQHVLGHLVLWGLTEPVMPWSSDGPDEAELGGALDVNLSDWADRTHAQGGTVVAAHFPHPNGEPAVLVATGRADAVEMLAHSDDGLLEYYRYLNCGYRLPIVGGTDKMSSAVPVGLYRTYARLGPSDELTYDGWCRAVRQGRTFLSGGPLLTLTVDGREPGDTVDLSGPGTVTVEARADSVFPLRSLEIVCNGELVAAETTDSAGHLSLSETVRVSGSSWIVGRAFGLDHHLDEWGRRVFAHTSPVYVACGGPWGMADPDGLHYMRTLIEGARDYVRHTAVRRADQLTSHHHGEPDHLAWLQRPFDEALGAVERRLGHSHPHPHR